MKNKNQITQAVKQIFRQQRGLHDPQIMHPYRDWLIGLVVGVVILVVSIGISILTYTKNKNSAQEPVDTKGAEVVQYRESLVAEALEKFSARQKIVAGIVGTTSEGEEIPLIPATTTIEIATSSSSTSPIESIDPIEPEPPVIEATGSIVPGF